MTEYLLLAICFKQEYYDMGFHCDYLRESTAKSHIFVGLLSFRCVHQPILQQPPQTSQTPLTPFQSSQRQKKWVHRQQGTQHHRNKIHHHIWRSSHSDKACPLSIRPHLQPRKICYSTYMYCIVDVQVSVQKRYENKH